MSKKQKYVEKLFWKVMRDKPLRDKIWKLARDTEEICMHPTKSLHFPEISLTEVALKQYQREYKISPYIFLEDLLCCKNRYKILHFLTSSVHIDSFSTVGLCETLSHHKGQKIYHLVLDRLGQTMKHEVTSFFNDLKTFRTLNHTTSRLQLAISNFVLHSNVEAVKYCLMHTSPAHEYMFSHSAVHHLTFQCPNILIYLIKHRKVDMNNILPTVSFERDPETGEYAQLQEKILEYIEAYLY